MISTNAHLNFRRPEADIAIRPARYLPGDMIGEQVGEVRLQAMASQDYLDNRPTDGDRWLGVTDLLSRSPGHHWQSRLAPDKMVFSADSYLVLAAHARAGGG